MNLRLTNLLCGAVALALLLTASSASAQRDLSDAQAVQPTEQELDDLPPAEPSRAARYALSNDRQEPSDYVRDILVLVNLGEGRLARTLMDELAGMQLTDEQRVDLVNEFGTGKIHRLARAEELGPQAKEFVSACMNAAGASAQDPQRLARLIEQVATGDKSARRAAMRGLQAAGESGAVACLTALAGTDDAKRQNRLREALVRMAPLANPMVAAALDSPDDSVRQQATWALGQLGDAASIPRLAAIAAGPEASQPVGKAARWSLEHMAGEAFSPASAESLLRAAILQSTSGVPARRNTSAGQTPVWSWDAGQKRPTKTHLPRDQAADVRTARLAGDLWRQNQGDPRSAVLAFAYRLQGEWLLSGADAASALPGPAADDLTAGLLSQSLELSLEENLTGAAIAVAQAMGERGNPELLLTPDAKPSPLAAALSASHPAVRFAALEAVMSINPTEPFPGSSRVTDALLHFASSDGESAAVVAMPKVADAATFSGRLAAEGVHGVITNLGAEVACEAADHPDVEFIVIDMGILRPMVREVLFRVRSQTPTADLPVVLLAADGQLDRAKRLAREHEGVLAYPRPHTTEATLSIVRAAREAAPRGLPTAAERGEHAAAAAGWLEKLLAEGPSFYDVRAHSAELLAAVNRSSDVASTIPSLALVGTPESQRTLANLASQDVLPIATRDAAAEAFDQSVTRHGLLLTRQQILDQYDRFNASETSDADTQRVLGALLDSIESRRNDLLSEGS